jgi:hypothetical protein
VDPFIVELKTNNKFIQLSGFDKVGYIVNIIETEEPKELLRESE